MTLVPAFHVPICKRTRFVSEQGPSSTSRCTDYRMSSNRTEERSGNVNTNARSNLPRFRCCSSRRQLLRPCTQDSPPKRDTEHPLQVLDPPCYTFCFMLVSCSRVLRWVHLPGRSSEATPFFTPGYSVVRISACTSFSTPEHGVGLCRSHSFAGISRRSVDIHTYI